LQAVTRHQTARDSDYRAAHIALRRARDE
jgi:hypothetical protein